MHRFPCLFPAILLCLTLLFSSAACTQADKTPPHSTETESPVIVSSALTVYFMNFGAADCAILQTESHLVIIDTGEKKHGNNIVQALQALGADKVDCLILSHPDKDHIGGAPDIISTGLVETVYMANYDKDSSEQNKLNSTIESSETTAITVTRTLSFVLDEVKFTVYPTALNHKGSDTSNEHSLGVLVEHGNNRMFFAGDGVNERLSEMASQIPNPETVDLLKVPHHGRFNSRSDDLIGALKPRIAILTCSQDEYADNRLLTLLNQVGADRYMTCHGIIVVTSDGNRLHVEA